MENGNEREEKKNSSPIPILHSTRGPNVCAGSYFYN